MKVINKINKRLVKDKIRMFFEIENHTHFSMQDGFLAIELPIDRFIGMNLSVEVKPIDSGMFGFVFFDVPANKFKSLKGFSWVLKYSIGIVSGNGVLTEKFENLYEG